MDQTLLFWSQSWFLSVWNNKEQYFMFFIMFLWNVDKSQLALDSSSVWCVSILLSWQLSILISIQICKQLLYIVTGTNVYLFFIVFQCWMKYNQHFSSSTILDYHFFSVSLVQYCESDFSVKGLCDTALELDQTWSFLKFRVDSVSHLFI